MRTISAVIHKNVHMHIRTHEDAHSDLLHYTRTMILAHIYICKKIVYTVTHLNIAQINVQLQTSKSQSSSRWNPYKHLHAHWLTCEHTHSRRTLNTRTQAQRPACCNCTHTKHYFKDKSINHHT